MISNKLKTAVVKSGRSLGDLSRATGVTKSTLSRFLSGKAIPRLEVADKLAVELGFELRKRRGGRT